MMEEGASSELERLTDLHARGGLSDQEFSKAKERVLSGAHARGQARTRRQWKFASLAAALVLVPALSIGIFSWLGASWLSSDNNDPDANAELATDEGQDDAADDPVATTSTVEEVTAFITIDEEAIFEVLAHSTMWEYCGAYPMPPDVPFELDRSGGAVDWEAEADQRTMATEEYLAQTDEYFDCVWSMFAEMDDEGIPPELLGITDELVAEEVELSCLQGYTSVSVTLLSRFGSRTDTHPC